MLIENTKMVCVNQIFVGPHCNPYIQVDIHVEGQGKGCLLNKSRSKNSIALVKHGPWMAYVKEHWMEGYNAMEFFYTSLEIKIFYGFFAPKEVFVCYLVL